MLWVKSAFWWLAREYIKGMIWWGTLFYNTPYFLLINFHYFLPYISAGLLVGLLLQPWLGYDLKTILWLFLTILACQSASVPRSLVEYWNKTRVVNQQIKITPSPLQRKRREFGDE